MQRKLNMKKLDEKTYYYFRDVIQKLGGIISEKDLLEHFSKDEITQNHIHLYLVLGDEFKKHKEFAHNQTNSDLIKLLTQQNQQKH